MQGNENNNPNSAESIASFEGDLHCKSQLSAKLRDKLDKYSQWRIHSSSIEFPGDDREFRGGYATVSRAILVSPSDVNIQGSNLVEGEIEERARKNDEPGAQAFERKVVAVKKMKVESNEDVERVLGLALREAGFLLKLSHKRIVKLEGFVEDVSKNVIWLFFPWEENGNLRDFLASEDWEIPERISLINDVARGLKYLHKQQPPICHGDLKSLNILVNSDYYAVITDFGSARRLGDETTDDQTKEDRKALQPASGPDPTADEESSQPQAVFCAATNTITLTGNNYTIRWAAPELLKDERPCLGSDIWALGWIAYEVMTNTIPFHDVKNEAIVVNRVVRGDLPVITDDTRMSLIRALCSLMVQCWSVNPEKRPTAEGCQKLISWMPRAVPAPRQAIDTDISKGRDFRLLSKLGQMYKAQGNYPNALNCYTKALDISTSALEATEKADILRSLADLHICQSEYSKAASCCSEALQIYTDADKQNKRAWALFLLAEIHRFKREYSDSVKLYSEAAQIQSDTGDRRGRGKALWGLACTYVGQQEYSRATTLYSESLQILTEFGSQRDTAMVLDGLADIHRLKGDFTEAINLHSEALDIYVKLGDRREQAITLFYFGNIHKAQGEYSEAIERYSEALRVNTEIGRKAGRAINLLKLAQTHRKLGHHSEAIPLFLEASKAYGELGESESADTALKQANDIRKRLEEAG